MHHQESEENVKPVKFSQQTSFIIDGEGLTSDRDIKNNGIGPGTIDVCCTDQQNPVTPERFKSATSLTSSDTELRKNSAFGCCVSNDRKMTLKKGSLLKVAVSLAVVVIVATIIVLIVHFTGKISEQDKSSSATIVQGELIISEGPFSQFHADYMDKSSLRFISFVQIFEAQMDILYSHSSMKSLFNKTVVNFLRNGSVIVTYTINFLEKTVISAELLRNLKQILVNEIGADHIFGSFVIDPSSVEYTKIDISLPSLSTTTERPSEEGKCVAVTMQYCFNTTGYTHTEYPNYFGHKSRGEALAATKTLRSPPISKCYDFSNKFWCLLWNRPCYNKTYELPCREFCYDVYESCNSAFQSMNISWPISCNELPSSKGSTSCVPNPYIPYKPVKLNIASCKEFGYNTTVFPNLVGQISEALAKTEFFLAVTMNSECYKNGNFFSCAVYFPKFSGNSTKSYHIIPPCRSLCIKYKRLCGFFMDVFYYTGIQNFSCSDLPDSNNSNICIGHEEANKPPVAKYCSRDSVKCDQTRCLDKSFICDGFRDCKDGSDETNCSQCLPGYIKCPHYSSLCISKLSRCDGREDCYGNLDEHGCVHIQPSNMSTTKVLEVMDPASYTWLPVCAEDWNKTFSELLCKQIGYKSVKDVSVTVQHSSSYFVIDTSVSRESPQKYISSNLQKRSTCNRNEIVTLQCADFVCGKRPAYLPSLLRIVGGERVKPGTWPWIVSIHGGPIHTFFCTGFIIHENWIVTAAHCIGDRFNTDGWTLIAGHTRRTSFSRYRIFSKVKRIIIHERFLSATVDNDIAMLQLTEPLYFNNYIRPVCLPQYNKPIPVGTRCVVAGWGKLQADNSLPYQDMMREVQLDVVKFDECKAKIEKQEAKPPYNLTKNMFCAGGGLNHDACRGDSGGPFMCRKPGTRDTWYAGGIVSWGVGCATPYVPGVYTELSRYLTWIDDNIKKYR